MLNHIDLFWSSWKTIKPTAWVILPDHFHIIINVKEKSISEIIHNFKRTFSWNYNFQTKKGRIWQNRFWDHIIRDGNDLLKHLDYIHYNPVRHKITNNPFEYNNSSLQKYYDAGYYVNGWGVKDDFNNKEEFGE